MIITIDGPAGAGKSSAARMLAGQLAFEFLDTGAMFRAVTLAALRTRLDLGDHSSVRPLLASFSLEMPAGRVVLNGEDISAAIRSSEVTAASGAIASNPFVRQRLAALQREMARGRDIVCEGRDQGTIVFPDAACKFYLVADPHARAKRRQHDLEARGEHVTFEEVLAAQELRDQRDAARDLAPMKPAEDAVIIDSTALTIEQVVARMETIVRERR